MSDGTYHDMIDVLMHGPYHVCRAVVPHMLRQGGGCYRAGCAVPGREAVAVTCRLASRARSSSTAATAATSAAPSAIRAICQPGMPPTVMTCIGAGALLPSEPPGGGKITAKAGAAPARASKEPVSPARTARERRMR